MVCGRQNSKMTLWCNVHLLVLIFPPLSVGGTWDLFLAHRVWQGWWDVSAMMLLHHGQCAWVDWKDREPAAGLEEANGHDPPMGDGHMAVSCSLDVKGTHCQPTASERWRLSVMCLQGNGLCQQAERAWNWSFPRWASRQGHSMADTLIEASWDPEQRTLLSHAGTPNTQGL